MIWLVIWGLEMAGNGTVDWVWSSESPFSASPAIGSAAEDSDCGKMVLRSKDVKSNSSISNLNPTGI